MYGNQYYVYIYIKNDMEELQMDRWVYHSKYPKVGIAMHFIVLNSCIK